MLMSLQGFLWVIGALLRVLGSAYWVRVAYRVPIGFLKGFCRLLGSFWVLLGY